MQVIIHHATALLGKMHTAWNIFLDEIFIWRFIWKAWQSYAWSSTSPVWKLLKSPKKGSLVFVTGVVMYSETCLYMQLESLNKYFRAKLKS